MLFEANITSRINILSIMSRASDGTSLASLMPGNLTMSTTTYAPTGSRIRVTPLSRAPQPA